jgi:predicted dehydrogenase
MNSTVTPQPGPISVAVVGLGFMGVTHLRTYLRHPRVKVTAVCGIDRLPENGVLRGVAGNLGASNDLELGPDVKAYRQIEAVLADPTIAAVDVCTPTPLHAAHTIAALRAGKHVICEKPLARTSVEARAILDVAAQANGFLMPAMCMRFWPGWSWLKSVVTDRPFGSVLAARFARFSERPAWSGATVGRENSHAGGALFDLHIHDTDFVNYLFGRPASVCSTGTISASSEIDHVVTQYQFPGGPVVHAEGSWLLARGFNMSYRLLCERATIEFNLSHGNDALVLTEAGHSPRVMACDRTDGYALELNYFIECVVSGKPPAIVTAHDGLAALEICEAEERSIRSGSIVTP